MRNLAYLGLLLVVGCSSISLEQSLEKDKGKKFTDLDMGHKDYFKFQYIDDKYHEMQWIRSDNCSWALVVRNDDDVIVGWRYLADPPPTNCQSFNTGA